LGLNFHKHREVNPVALFASYTCTFWYHCDVFIAANFMKVGDIW